MSNLVIRNYRQEDLPAVIELYSSSQIKAPFIVRDKDSFDYFTSYPGVKTDSIFIAASEDKIEGVAILAIIQKRYNVGRIIELWATDATAQNALLQKAAEYCRNNDIDAVEVKAPTFLDSGKTFADWQRMDQREVMMAKPLSLVPLFQALLDTTTSAKIGDGKRFLLICDDETIEVEISQAEAKIIERDKSWQDKDGILVEVSSKTLLEMIFGRANPYLAFLSKRIKIRGIRNILPTIQMLKAIRIDQPWTVAIVDRR